MPDSTRSGPGSSIARYDSRDGYGYHVRQPVYIAADAATPAFHHCPKPGQPTATKSTSAPSGGGGCAAGYSPCLPIVDDLDCGDISGPVTVTGADQYRLDADGDGTGCQLLTL